MVDDETSGPMSHRHHHVGQHHHPHPTTTTPSSPSPSVASGGGTRAACAGASPIQLSSPAPAAAAAAAAATHGVPSPSLQADRVRGPNPGKKAPKDPELDQFRDAVTAATLQSRSPPRPPTTAAPTATTTGMTFSPSSRPDPRDGRTAMPRTASIDSTVSSLSTASQRPPGGGTAYRVSQESAGPQDVGAVIAAAGGSAEAAVQKLLSEKNQAASHNAQLWRLVEKQRAMILGLNKDLEKALKEKERYRKRVKEHVVQSQSAPLLSAGNAADDGADDGTDTRESCESPALPAEKSTAPAPAVAGRSLREFTLDSRKPSDASELAPVLPGRSDTPQNAENFTTSSSSSSSGVPAAPYAAGSGIVTRDADRDMAAVPPHGKKVIATAPVPPGGGSIAAPQPSPRASEPPSSPKAATRLLTPLSPTTIPAPSQGMSSPQTATSPKSATRKAPPAPLQLSPQATANITNNIIDPSDSEYEDEPESARAEQAARGRRRTREEDDRERETIALQEMEGRSRSKKKSKSKSKVPGDAPQMPAVAPAATAPHPTAVQPAPSEARGKMYAFQPTDDPAALLRQRAVSDAAGVLQKSNTAPSLLSPGLPMSPRPIDKPINSPLPRAPNKILNSLPMSPRGMAGLPLSPRAPRQPLPLPPQTPLTFASPHLARAEAYHQHVHAPSHASSLADTLLKSSSASAEPSPEHERPSTSSDAMPKFPGEVYRGLVTEQYPDLLLPPNALPSIYVRTSSSRMKPSRQSVTIMPRLMDESPVLTLAVHERADRKQLWRVEKTLAALAALDGQVKAVCGNFRERLPERAIFSGHAPVKIDARRAALDRYFERMLDSIQNDAAAKVVCRFLTADAFGAASGDYFAGHDSDLGRPDTPLSRLRPQRAGYLTKRGKNFGGWKARYFVLDGPQLKYFEAPGGAHLGSIKLPNAQIGKQSAQSHVSQEDEDNQFRHAFLILEPKKKDSSSLVRHVLCAESDEERDAWVDALLQYVDFKEDEEESVKGTTYVQPGPDITGAAARSPRLQKSLNDLRPPSRSRDARSPGMEGLRGMSYNDTVAGEAPVIGHAPGLPRKPETPSPPHDAATFPGSDHGPGASSTTHPTISGPTNLHVIANAGDWGMKSAAAAPPTPQSLAKDKKRGMFAAFRGRSSSDLAPAAPGSPSLEGHGRGGRAVFGVPLAEAVEFAHPADAPTTELPAVVYRCIEYLIAKNAIAEEGIFRLSGSNTVIKSLKDRFNHEGDVNLAAEEHYYDIHAVASLLKLYLRELPASILTRELHLEFLSCLEMHGREREKIEALNGLVNRLPRPNRALLSALSEFLGSIVNNADVNKMNVRNGEFIPPGTPPGVKERGQMPVFELTFEDILVGIVFAPTLNVPAPLISSFVEDQAIIFGPPIDPDASPSSLPTSANSETSPPAPLPTDLRSPRKQMFSDLPTPAYHQTSFATADMGMIPLQPSYASYQIASQGEGGFGSLNDALRSPFGAANGATATKSRRRESAMMLLQPGSGGGAGVGKKGSMTQLREEEGGSF